MIPAWNGEFNILPLLKVQLVSTETFAVDAVAILASENRNQIWILTMLI